MQHRFFGKRFNVDDEQKPRSQKISHDAIYVELAKGNMSLLNDDWPGTERTEDPAWVELLVNT